VLHWSPWCSSCHRSDERGPKVTWTLRPRLTLGMAWLIVLPIALVAISGGLDRRQDVFGELTTFFPGWYGRAVDLAVLLVAALAAALLLRRLTATRTPVHTAGLFAILVWVVAQASGFQVGGCRLSATAYCSRV
jgi:hypothetical protein